MILFYQILAVMLLVLLAVFFSGSETGVYRLSRFRLRLGIQQGKRFYGILGDVVRDSHGLVMTTLIGNNLANYIATSLVTYIFLSRTDSSHSAEFYATAIMAPVLFVIGDIIPKSMFYLHSNTLMPRVAPLLWFFHKLFTWSGAVGLLKLISRCFSRLFRVGADAVDVLTAGRKTHIRQIISETRDEGIVSSFQTDAMERTTDIPTMPVRTVMIPFTQVVTAEMNTDTAGLMKTLGESPCTRLPVFRKSKKNIVGFVNIYNVLASGEKFESLDGFVKPIGRVLATTSVLDAITQMLKHNHKIMLVMPDYEDGKKANVLGIVTMKDLVEELTGELTPWQD